MKKMLTKILTCILAVMMIVPVGADDPHTHDHTDIVVETETVEISERISADPITDLTVSTEEISATSGRIGDSNVEWNLDTSTGRMVFTGSGDCEAFISADDQPWAAVREQITEVWFSDMETLTISDLAYWFDGCSSLVMAEIPYTTPVIGTRAFADCPALETILLYYMEETFSIRKDAFVMEELTPLEVRYIPSSVSTSETLAGYAWSEDNRVPYYSDVYGMMILATATCPSCGVTCTYTPGYDPWTDTQHIKRRWCSNCDRDMYGGVLGEAHTMSNGVCTLCGYDDGTGSGSGGGSASCTHPDTSYYWNSCTWYEYCNSCSRNLSTGVVHRGYTYGAWEYSDTSQHRRLYSCTGCGEGSWEYGLHSHTNSYTQYDSYSHTVSQTCFLCGYSTGSSGTQAHSWSYGSFEKYNSSQHRRTKTCYSCGYSTYEYSGHSLSYGSWTKDSDTRHKRTVSCACGYSGTETADHSFLYGNWASYKDSKHRRSKSCACGYSGYEYEEHEHTTVTDVFPKDSKQHTITYACDCGHTIEELEDHTFTYGEWESCNDAEHSREIFCDCGFSDKEYDFHTDDDFDGYCDECDGMTSRFSVTLPAVMAFVVSGDGEVYAATNAAIVNNSTDKIIVSSVTVSAGDNWTLVPYNYNMANEKVDSRLIGFSLNELSTTSFGYSETLEPSDWWIIDTDTPCTLDYDAVVSATSDVIRNEQVLTLVFVVNWLLL